MREIERHRLDLVEVGTGEKVPWALSSAIKGPLKARVIFPGGQLMHCPLAPGPFRTG